MKATARWTRIRPGAFGPLLDVGACMSCGFRLREGDPAVVVGEEVVRDGMIICCSWRCAREMVRYHNREAPPSWQLEVAWSE